MNTVSTTVYLCMVYENYKHYRYYNKFHEICLTKNQILMKEKYIDKDSYIIEFFIVPVGFEDTIYNYIKEKFIKTSFPFNARKGELQAVCLDFIKKCQDIQEEKVKLTQQPQSVTSSLMITPPLSPSSSLSFKLIALIHHHMGGITLVTNNDDTTPMDTYQQLCQQVNILHVLQHTIMVQSEATTIIEAFHKDFHHYQISHQEFGLVWYNITEAGVMQWFQKKLMAVPPSQPPIPSVSECYQSDCTITIDDIQDNTNMNQLFGGDIIISDMNEKEVITYVPSNANKKRKNMK